jgi:spheroidene monooxygenase
MGLGEAPLVRQCTFSLWKDTGSMLQYAQQGAHQVASAAAYKHQFFSESLFVRMQVLQMAGVWMGRSYDPQVLKLSAASPVELKASALEPSHV